MTYQEIVAVYSENPRDVSTNPVKSKTPIWYYVSGKNGKLWVSAGKYHMNKSRITISELKESEMEAMLDIYHRRKRGDKVSGEAAKTTRFQVYWYGIFSELGL